MYELLLYFVVRNYHRPTLENSNAIVQVIVAAHITTYTIFCDVNTR